MSPAVRTETVLLDQVDTAERERLVDELYPVQQEVFDGVSRDTFAKYVIESPASQSWLQVFREPHGAAVGYMAWHRFEREFAAEKVSVFRAEAGSLREYRGRTPLGSQALRILAGYRARHPFEQIVYLGALVHPSSYLGLANTAAEIWPSYQQETPPHLLEFMSRVGDAFDLARVDRNNPLVREVGWITRDTDVERGYWRKSNKPHVQFFLRTNPGYVRGNGLITLIPLQATKVARGIARYAGRRFRRTTASLQVNLQRMPLLRPSAGTEELKAVLAALPALQGLDAEALGGLARASEVVIVAAGRYVFRQGDEGDAMYVLLSGAAYVLLEGDGETVVLDELGRGEIVGEMALLSGEPRSASVRAAGATKLLKVDGAQLDRLSHQAPNIRDALWRLFSFRRFDSYLRGDHRFGAMDRDARRRWFETGTLTSPEDSRAIETADWRLLFLVDGRIELETDDGPVTLDAPSLLETSRLQRLVAGAGATVLGLPESPQEATAGT